MTLERGLAVRIDQAAMRLVEEFRHVVAEEHVRALVMESAGSLHHSRVPDFVPLFIYRGVREQLKGVHTHVEEGHTRV
jgi:hypothetical protein